VSREREDAERGGRNNVGHSEGLWEIMREYQSFVTSRNAICMGEKLTNKDQKNYGGHLGREESGRREGKKLWKGGKDGQEKGKNFKSYWGAYGEKRGERNSKLSALGIKEPKLTRDIGKASIYN